MQPKGRLDLTWVGKDRALLNTVQGGYEWVDSYDARVAEVRLLEEIERVGSTNEGEPPNMLIEGDSYDALRALTGIPEFSSHYAGKFRLVYVDPPFNTGQAFEHYDDALEHSVWLTMMRDRISLVHKLLRDDGSIWVHLDDAEVHYCKILLDEIFGRENFAGSVIWRSADTSNYDAKQFSVDHNTILVYGKRAGWTAKPIPRSLNQSSHYTNPDNDPRGPWFDGNPVNSPNPRPNLMYSVISPTGFEIQSPPNGWRWQESTTREKLGSGEIRFSVNGRRIIYRTYLWEQDDIPPSSLWQETSETGSNRKAKNELKKLFALRASEVFKTPKPESLLQRVIEVATDKGDLVLDFFGGSGTTASVAHKTGRRWVMVEREESTIQQFALPRLRKVVSGEDAGGISTVTRKISQSPLVPATLSPDDVKLAASIVKELADAGAMDQTNVDGSEVVDLLRRLSRARNVCEKVWGGGGGFLHMRVAASIFEVVDGRVLLAENATNGRFAAGVRAQLNYAVDDSPPFCGRRGRSRLVALDGVADADTVAAVVSRLGDTERVFIVAKAVTPEAQTILREISPGSRLLKAPQDLVRRRAVR